MSRRETITIKAYDNKYIVIGIFYPAIAGTSSEPWLPDERAEFEIFEITPEPPDKEVRRRIEEEAQLWAEEQ